MLVILRGVFISKQFQNQNRTQIPKIRNQYEANHHSQINENYQNKNQMKLSKTPQETNHHNQIDEEPENQIHQIQTTKAKSR